MICFLASIPTNCPQSSMAYIYTLSSSLLLNLHLVLDLFLCLNVHFVLNLLIGLNVHYIQDLFPGLYLHLDFFLNTYHTLPSNCELVSI